MEGIKISNLLVDIASNKPDTAYEYEGPIEDMPRNISPVIIIAGLPGSIINNVSFNNIELKHPGGGNPLFAKVMLNELDSVPEMPTAYPDFSKFKELPAWGIYIRHATRIQFSNMKLTCVKKDYRTAIVLDDVHDCHFTKADIKEPQKKQSLFQRNSSDVILK